MADESTRRRRKEARPQELVEAALALFAEKGFAATRIDDVAARAGVTKGTVYLYFESKEALFKAVIDEGIVPVLVYGEQMLSGPCDDPVQLMRCLLFGWWEMIGATPLGAVPKLMIAEARNFPDLAAFYQQEVILRGRKLMSAALQRGIDAGVFRPVDVEVLSTLAMAPVMHLALWKHSFEVCCGPGGSDPETYLETHFSILMNGLLSQPSPPEA